MTTELDPETLSWPSCMPSLRRPDRRGKSSRVSRRFVRELRRDPAKGVCPKCGQRVPCSRLVSEAFYETDCCAPWASWSSSRTYHCPACGDQVLDGVEWITRPDDWDSFVPRA